MRIEGGCILLARKLLRSPSWQSLRPEGKMVMVTLLTIANHKDNKWYNPITKQEVIIKRGQCIVGRKTLAKKSGVGEQSVRTALTLLKSTNFLTIEPTNLFSIITITNYEYYQNLKNYANQVSNQETNQLPTNLQPTPNQPLTTNNNDNNDNNDNKENRVGRERIKKIIDTVVEKKGYDKTNQTLITSVYKRHGKAAKELLLLINNDDYAVRAIRWVADMCHNKGLDWTLETVIKWLPDFMTKYPPEDKTPQEFKDLTKTIGK